MGFTAVFGAAIAMGGVAPGAAAQSLAHWSVTGSGRASVWSGSRDLDEAGPLITTGIWMRAVGRIDANNTILADGLGQVADGRDNGRLQDARVRELFWKRREGDVDLRIGRQLFAWGRADGINPTDSIGRRTFSRLTSDDSDQRDGSDAVSATYFLNDAYSVQAIWLPGFRSDVIPLRPQPMLTVTTVEPGRTRQYALKLDGTGGAVDWSMSYFDGFDRMPDLGIKGFDANGIQAVLANHPVRTIGADFSSAVEGGVLRGEVAWSKRYPDSASDAFFRKRSQLLVVLGGDRNFRDSLNVNLQLFGQWVPQYRNPDELDPMSAAVARIQSAINNQPATHQYGVTYRIAKSWLNETWQAELSGVHSLTTHGSVVRALVRHAVDDRWRLNLGLDRYSGSDATVFGQLRSNSAAYAELRYLF